MSLLRQLHGRGISLVCSRHAFPDGSWGVELRIAPLASEEEAEQVSGWLREAVFAKAETTGETFTIKRTDLN